MRIVTGFKIDNAVCAECVFHPSLQFTVCTKPDSIPIPQCVHDRLSSEHERRHIWKNILSGLSPPEKHQIFCHTCLSSRISHDVWMTVKMCRLFMDLPRM